MRCSLKINGFDVEAVFDDASVGQIFLPLLDKIAARARETSGRVIVFLAAPPATGKSTLAAFLENLAARTPGMPAFQALGMDGFHFPQSYIKAHTVFRNGEEIAMQRVKGAPDTFDVKKLDHTLRLAREGEVMWPFYDRRLHDVVEDAIKVTGKVILVEGNWLLLDAPGWKALPRDLSVFVEAEEKMLRSRLIARKMRGGLSRKEATVFYEECDGPNVRLCMEKSLPADVRLKMTGEGVFLPV